MTVKRMKFMEMPASTGGDGEGRAIPFINSKMFAPETLLIMVSDFDPSPDEEEELERVSGGEKIDPKERKPYIPAIYPFFQYDYSEQGYRPGKAPTLHAYEEGDEVVHPNFDVTVTDSSGRPAGLKSRSLAYVFNLTAYRALIDRAFIDNDSLLDDGSYDDNLYPDILESNDLFYQNSTEQKVVDLRGNDQFNGLMLYEFGPHVIQRLQPIVMKYTARAKRKGEEFKFSDLILSFTQTYDQDGKPDYGKPNVAAVNWTSKLPQYVRNYLAEITKDGLPPLYPRVWAKKYRPEEDSTPQKTLNPPRQARAATAASAGSNGGTVNQRPTDAEIDDMDFENDR